MPYLNVLNTPKTLNTYHANRILDHYAKTKKRAETKHSPKD